MEGAFSILRMRQMLETKRQSSQIEIKISKNGHKVPLLKGIHLHSIYDPIKEAEALIHRFDESIKEKKYFLILGLGFGYHIKALINKLHTMGDSDFKIIVIEPNKSLVDCFQDNFPAIENVTIFQAEQVSEIYAQRKVVDFLCHLPLVLAHPASLNLHDHYFKSFLSFSSDNSVGSVLSHMSKNETYQALQRIENSDFDIANIASSPSKLELGRSYFLLKAIDAMASMCREV